jgi:CheY-like chemotaxis protein
MHLVDSLQGLSLALVDLDLPGVDGFTLIRKLHESHPNLPTIAISGVFQPHVLESATACGASAVLHKPITREWKTVVDRVRKPAAR